MYRGLMPALFHRRHRLLSDELAPELHRLKRREGVLAVGVGQRRVNGEWIEDELGVIVNVARKHEPRQPAAWLPKLVGRHRVQVEELGEARAYVASGTTVLRPQAPGVHSGGSITAVVPANLEWGQRAALLCGHGSLPIVHGFVARAFEPGLPQGLSARGGEVNPAGTLVAGGITAWSDWSVGTFDGGDLDPVHPLLGSAPPWPVLHDAPQGTRVALWSGLGQVRREAVIRGVIDAVALLLEDHTLHRYVSVYDVYAATDGPGASPQFSQPGDSGSLVVEASTGRVVGTLLGGTSGTDRSFVLPVRPLRGPLSAAVPGLDLYPLLFHPDPELEE